MKSGLHKHVADLKELVKVEWKKYDVSSNLLLICTKFSTCLVDCYRKDHFFFRMIEKIIKDQNIALYLFRLYQSFLS